MQIETLPIRISSGILLAAVIAGISYRHGSLNLSGAITTIIIGGIIFGLGGLHSAIPLLFFYFSSISFSAIKTNRKRYAMENLGKSGPRDWIQVLANGGAGTVCIIVHFITGNDIWFYAYLASIAEAASDTWATELGTLSSSDPISIISLKKVQPGLSGGVSLIGILAAITAAASTIGICYFAQLVFPEKGEIRNLPILLATANAGFAGAILDSILGGSLQGMYKCLICKRLTEKPVHCGIQAQLMRGFAPINNDIVNLIGTTFSATMMLIFFLI